MAWRAVRCASPPPARQRSATPAESLSLANPNHPPRLRGRAARSTRAARAEEECWAPGRLGSLLAAALHKLQDIDAGERSGYLAAEAMPARTSGIGTAS